MTQSEDPAASSARDGTQVLQRAVDILRVVARLQREGATLARITHATGLSRTTAFRIVQFLAKQRLLDHDEARGSYHLGALAFELGLAARGHGALAEQWRDRLHAISAETRMTSYLVVRSDTEVVCLATAEAPSILRAVPLVVGQRLPLGVGAGSLAILASLPDPEARALIAANRDRYARLDGGVLSEEALHARIAQARADGFAVSRDSVARGVCGVGVRVGADASGTQMAVSVSAPADAFDTARVKVVGALLKEVCST